MLESHLRYDRDYFHEPDYRKISEDPFILLTALPAVYNIFIKAPESFRMHLAPSAASAFRAGLESGNEAERELCSYLNRLSQANPNSANIQAICFSFSCCMDVESKVQKATPTGYGHHSRRSHGE